MTYVVVITSQRTPVDDGYGEAAERMAALAEGMPGYGGMETVRGADGAGITVSYWDSLEALRAWREQAEHVAVQELGRQRWYEHYRITLASVERESRWRRPAG